jgi:ABC-type transport system involved in multi-copper enzyme maturation permease subunit
MFTEIWKKEVKGELYTWKSMLWLVIASALFSITSYLLLTDKELSLLDQTEMLWLLAKVIVGTALLIVTIDASSTITSEFEKETAESLFLSPLRLSDFIIGKMLAGLTLWLSIYVVSAPYIIVTSAGTHLTIPFLCYIALLGSLGIIPIIMIVFGISFLYRSGKNTLSTSLVILLLLVIPALFSSTLKNNAFAMTLSRLNPVDNIFASLDNVLVDYKLSLTQNMIFITPLLVFLVIGLIFMVLAAYHFYKQGVIKNG